MGGASSAADLFAESVRMAGCYSRWNSWFALVVMSGVGVFIALANPPIFAQDASLKASPSLRGVVIDTKLFARGKKG